jgi:lipopolysaccharide transport system permease protein
VHQAGQFDSANIVRLDSKLARARMATLRMIEAQVPRSVLVLRPERRLSRQDFVDIWNYRELLWILAVRDVKVRYKQATLGVAWALLQPLAQMAIFTILFHRFAGIRADAAVPYPVFCFAGLTIWSLFATGLLHASESLLYSSNLVTKVYFPRVIIPMAAVLTSAIDAAIAGAFLLVLMAIMHVPLHLTAILAVPIAGIAALSAIALGLWTSALNLQYRDVRHALPFFIQVMVYATPVFYSAEMVPERYRPLLALNPMAAVVDGFRAAMFGTPIPFGKIALAVAFVTVVGFFGFLRFRRIEQTFADRI